jgi:hypothetical protein
MEATIATGFHMNTHRKPGERWRSQPRVGHTVLWTAIGMGSMLVPDELGQGELLAFTPSSGVG